MYIIAFLCISFLSFNNSVGQVEIPTIPVQSLPCPVPLTKAVPPTAGLMPKVMPLTSGLMPKAVPLTAGLISEQFPQPVPTTRQRLILNQRTGFLYTVH